MTAQRERLLNLLAGLDDAEWGSATVAPEWSVKDVALHLIDVDLSWVARFRDHDRSGFIPQASGHDAFVRALAQHNQRWIDGTQVLSPQLIADMLRWSGGQLDEALAMVDLSRPSSVYWAGEAPLWFDLAREFTERWVHFQQIRAAVARPDSGPDARDTGEVTAGQDEYLPLVVCTFIWGFPHQYRAPDPAGYHDRRAGQRCRGVVADEIGRRLLGPE